MVNIHKNKYTLVTLYNLRNQETKNRQVLLGQSDLNNENYESKNTQKIDINITSVKFDIGIISTAKDINFTNDTKPICFSNQPFKPEQLLKKDFGLVGWEKETDQEYNFFNWVPHWQVYNQETCQEKYDPQERKNNLTQETFCAGSNVRFFGNHTDCCPKFATEMNIIIVIVQKV